MGMGNLTNYTYESENRTHALPLPLDVGYDDATDLEEYDGIL
jgi:hypothetical protein